MEPSVAIAMNSLTVGIVDYGMGNLASVEHACATLGAVAFRSSDSAELARANALILPGVGAFGEAMHNLRERKLVQSLDTLVNSQGLPILGICLGMQLLFDRSDEYGSNEGLGWIPGAVSRMQVDAGTPLPHVGWNEVQPTVSSPLFEGLTESLHFFFDHSYAASCDASFVTATTRYGGDVVASVCNKHIFGVQFHPEKSQRSGLRILKRFLSFASKRAEHA